MKKKFMFLGVLLLALAVILPACHKAPIDLIVENVNCPTFMLQYKYLSGGVSPPGGAPHSLSLTASLGDNGPFKYTTGVSHWVASGGAVGEGDVDFNQPGGWRHRFTCSDGEIVGAEASTQ